MLDWSGSHRLSVSSGERCEDKWVLCSRRCRQQPSAEAAATLHSSLTQEVAAESKKSQGTRTSSGRPEGRSVPHTMALFHTPRKERERENRVLMRRGQEVESEGGRPPSRKAKSQSVEMNKTQSLTALQVEAIMVFFFPFMPFSLLTAGEFESRLYNLSESGPSLGQVNSYQRTQMNLRGLSYWMLPSQPVSRLSYSRLDKVRSRLLVPGGASISFKSQCASPFTAAPGTISRLASPSPPEPTATSSTSRLSQSADPSPPARRAPRWGAHAAAYTVGATATDKNSLTSLRIVYVDQFPKSSFFILDRGNLAKTPGTPCETAPRVTIPPSPNNGHVIQVSHMINSERIT
ncbi:hypothetical protein INR49_024170 [Caranx melampygus]|nr:hypothetical protein INR49_024170 [Caranx melampygus]